MVAVFRDIDGTPSNQPERKRSSGIGHSERAHHEGDRALAGVADVPRASECSADLLVGFINAERDIAPHYDPRATTAHCLHSSIARYDEADDLFG